MKNHEEQHREKIILEVDLLNMYRKLAKLQDPDEILLKSKIRE